jgi:hypothetical protein
LVDGCTELAAALATLPSGLLEIVADAVAGQDVTNLYKWPSLFFVESLFYRSSNP